MGATEMPMNYPFTHNASRLVGNEVHKKILHIIFQIVSFGNSMCCRQKSLWIRLGFKFCFCNFLLGRLWASSLPLSVTWRWGVEMYAKDSEQCWYIMLSPPSSQFRAKRRKRQEGTSWAVGGMGWLWVLYIGFTTHRGGQYQNSVQERVRPSLLVSVWLLK